MPDIITCSGTINNKHTTINKMIHDIHCSIHNLFRGCFGVPGNYHDKCQENILTKMLRNKEDIKITKDCCVLILSEIKD